MERAGEYLVMDPAFQGPEEPTGLWICDSPETVLTVQLNAVCLRPGAGWDDVGKCLDFIRAYKYAVIVSPVESTRNVMVKELRPRLPATSLYVVESAGFRGARTMRGFVEIYGPNAVREILAAARELPAYGLLNLADVPQRDISKIPRTLSRLPNLDRGIGGFFAGEVSVWTGKRGTGKSTILGQILLSAVDQGRKVCAYSGELDRGQFREWIDLQAAGPDRVVQRTDPVSGKQLCRVDELTHQRISQWLDQRFWIFDLDCAAVHDEDRILDQFEYAWMRYGADVFLVDNIMTVDLKGARLEDYYRAQSRFVGRLVTFAKRRQAHVHLVVHPRKTKNNEVASSDDVGGSGDITNRVDNVFVMGTTLLDEGGISVPHPRLDIYKNRDFGSQGHVNLTFDKKSRRLYQVGESPHFRYGWDLDGGQVRLDELPQTTPTPFDGEKG